MEGHLSNPQPVNCEVPQGSILGPPLFICYINDLAQQCCVTKPFLYADGTALFVSGPSWPTQVVEFKQQMDLNALYNQFAQNKLSVNCDNSNAMLFTNNRSKHCNDVLSLDMGGKSIEQVSEFKYLALYLDPKLIFNSHISKICSKINVYTKLLWRIRSFISKDLAFPLYHPFIEAHICIKCVLLPKD